MISTLPPTLISSSHRRSAPARQCPKSSPWHRACNKGSLGLVMDPQVRHRPPGGGYTEICRYMTEVISYYIRIGYRDKNRNISISVRILTDEMFHTPSIAGEMFSVHAMTQMKYSEVRGLASYRLCYLILIPEPSSTSNSLAWRFSSQIGLFSLPQRFSSKNTNGRFLQ